MLRYEYEQLIEKVSAQTVEQRIIAAIGGKFLLCQKRIVTEAHVSKCMKTIKSIHQLMGVPVNKKGAIRCTSISVSDDYIVLVAFAMSNVISNAKPIGKRNTSATSIALSSLTKRKDCPIDLYGDVMVWMVPSSLDVSSVLPCDGLFESVKYTIKQANRRYVALMKDVQEIHEGTLNHPFQIPTRVIMGDEPPRPACEAAKIAHQRSQSPMCCAECGELSNARLRKCSRCALGIHFCNDACAKKGWKVHKLYCEPRSGPIIP